MPNARRHNSGRRVIARKRQNALRWNDSDVFLVYFKEEDLRELKKVDEELTREYLEETKREEYTFKGGLTAFLSWLTK